MEEPVTDGHDYARHRQLALVDVVTPISHSISTPSPTSASVKMSPSSKLDTSKFTLPKDWFVEKVPRKFGGGSDKYYHDPETGRKFRSLREVERYVTEGLTPTKSRVKRQNNHHHHEKNSGSRKMIGSSGKMLDFEENKDNQYQLANVSATNISSRSPFKLPDGWVVEEVPRRSGGYIDKYYYEPGTGQRFRSLLAVQKHLAELEENSPLSVVLEELRENNLPLSKAFKLSSSIKNHGSYNSWKKSIPKKEKTPSFISPPSKINWVIAGSGGDTWNAFVGDTLVSDSVKQQWGKTFMLAINNSQRDAPISG